MSPEHFREIPLPDLNQVSVSFDALVAPFVEIVQQQGRVIGIKTAQIDLLTDACAKLREQNAALKQYAMVLEAQARAHSTAAPPDEVTAKRKAG